jgi:hypothetical protein
LNRAASAAQGIAMRLPVLEQALLYKLQHTCSDELQRNLRKQQRERIDGDRHASQAFEDARAHWMRMNMLFSLCDYAKLEARAGAVAAASVDSNELEQSDRSVPVSTPAAAAATPASVSSPSSSDDSSLDNVAMAMVSPVAPSIASLMRASLSATANAADSTAEVPQADSAATEDDASIGTAALLVTPSREVGPRVIRFLPQSAAGTLEPLATCSFSSTNQQTIRSAFNFSCGPSGSH